MKKYVKPMMESELFVANEYIGACWIVKCDGNKSIKLIGDQMEEELHGAGLTIISQDNGYVVTGTIDGCTGEYANIDHSHTKQTVDLKCKQWYWGLGSPIICPLIQREWQKEVDAYDNAGYHHHVTITQTKGTGPNAS